MEQRIRIKKEKKDEQCNHNWEKDLIDLPPERSMMVWSCSICHEITTKKY